MIQHLEPLLLHVFKNVVCGGMNIRLRFDDFVIQGVIISEKLREGGISRLEAKNLLGLVGKFLKQLMRVVRHGLGAPEAGPDRS